MPTATGVLARYLPKGEANSRMLRERILVSLVLVPLGCLMIGLGGWFYAAFVTLLLGICAWEYWRMIKSGGYNTSMILFVTGVVVMVISRFVWSDTGTEIVIGFFLLAFMTYHTIAYQRGEDGSATHFTMALGGLFYLGWMGGYLILLRSLPDGDLWVLTALPAAWFADTGAYFVGSRFGKHKMASRVSPKKSWEGYLAGVVSSVIFTALMAAAWSLRAPQITPLKGAILGLIMGAVTPLGDLGESMLKRQFGFKDTSGLLPGHGGMLDRLDTTLWAGILSYFIITLFMLS